MSMIFGVLQRADLEEFIYAGDPQKVVNGYLFEQWMEAMYPNMSIWYVEEGDKYGIQAGPWHEEFELPDWYRGLHKALFNYVGSNITNGEVTFGMLQEALFQIVLEETKLRADVAKMLVPEKILPWLRKYASKTIKMPWLVETFFFENSNKKYYAYVKWKYGRSIYVSQNFEGKHGTWEVKVRFTVPSWLRVEGVTLEEEQVPGLLYSYGKQTLGELADRIEAVQKSK